MSSYITDVDLFDVTSSVSIPFYQLSLPEGEGITAEFVYNYYTRDEGVSEKTFLGSIDSRSDQYRFVLENWERGTLPRQINLTFGGKSPYENVTLDSGVLTRAVKSESVIFEDAPFSTKFSSLLVHDTSIDEKIYRVSERIGGESISSRGRDILNVSKLQALGHRFSKAETREAIANLYEIDVKSINLGVSLNNLFVADVLKTVGKWQASAFIDEFASAIEEAQTTQNTARSEDEDPFLISEQETDVNLKVIESRLIRGLTSYITSTAFLETLKTTKIGYIIEKYGEQLDGTTLRYPDIIIEDPNETAFTDGEVRYGASYKYRIRTVYQTYMISPHDSGNGLFDGFYEICTLFVASEGAFTSIKCEESIPPSPPNNISFQQTLFGLYIRWNLPINTQKDIKRFQVFRRPNIDLPFELLREINFDLTILPYSTGEKIPQRLIEKYVAPVKHFIDSDFSDIDSDFIYAICAIDAHGLSSAYSEQFRVRFDKITGKLLVTRVSPEGAPKPYPNVKVLGDFFSDLIKDSGHSRIRIYFDPEYSDVTRAGKSLSLISAGDIGIANYKLSLTEINLARSQVVDIYVEQNPVGEDGIPVSLARFYTAS